MIKHLTVKNVRNIESISLDLEPTVNFIFGENGSGKTSLLEAMYLLGTGGSFRTKKVKNIIRDGETSALVTGSIVELNERSGASQESHIGLRRSTTGVEIKKNGENIKKRAELALSLPLLAVTPTSHYLLEAGPRWRRRYLDWGVFHVEQNFAKEWSLYQRALKQRNKILSQKDCSDREKLALLASLDISFVEIGAKIEAARIDYFHDLLPYLEEIAKNLLSFGLQIELKKGYPESQTFSDVITENKHIDVKAGITRFGPHRADLVVKVGRFEASDYLSRGQQKLLIYALLLAQIRYLKVRRNKDTVLLLDDVASELDEQKLSSLLDFLKEQFTQVFITGVDKQKFPIELVNKHRVFHVEQGHVS